LLTEKYIGGDAYYRFCNLTATSDGGLLITAMRYDYLTQDHERDAYIFKFDSIDLTVGIDENINNKFIKLKIFYDSQNFTLSGYQHVLTIERPKYLHLALDILTKPVTECDFTPYINEKYLNKIIISESIKSYHTKSVDEENKKGYFKSYKSVVQSISDIILEIKPDFQYSHMLVSTIIEGAQHQRYFAEHLPALTDINKEKNTIEKFYKEMVLNFIK
jgi:hypothetical protein